MARFCPSRAFILALGGMGFAVPFYFVQDCRGIWYTAIKTWLGVFVVIFLKTLYKKTIIGFGSCDIRNNQGRGRA